MRRVYTAAFAGLLLLGLAAILAGQGGYVSRYIVSVRGLCSTGGGMFVTGGMYNCYRVVDAYAIKAGYVALGLALLSLVLGVANKSKPSLPQV